MVIGRMRNFNNAQRKALLLSSDYCSNCGQPLDRMHADNIIPFSKGGSTQIHNAQALCPSGNILKSNKIMGKQIKLREWQQNAFKRLLKVFREGKKEFLCVAGVGSGKFLKMRLQKWLAEQMGVSTTTMTAICNNKLNLI